MSYTVTILNKKYDLPPRTLSVDDSIETVVQANKQYEADEITRRGAAQQIHNFVESLAPGALPAMEDVDTNDLFKACLDIISAYDAPARKMRIEAQLADIAELAKNKDVKDLVAVAKAKR